VWEEILILLHQSVKIVALSATVSNVEDFGDWLRQVRGSCTFVIEEKRPVPLTQVIATSSELIPLISIEDTTKLNSKVSNLYKRNFTKSHSKSEVPDKSQLVDLLAKFKLLPSIYFIFSRKGCEQAVQILQKSNTRLTSPDERSEIEQLIRNRFDDIATTDWATLKIDDWIDCATRGFGSHHAGLIPQLKEITELLFQKGLMKVVFATETLAVGVNMPAKSVVLERMDKWNGDSHEYLTPAEFTQLTGRAGRRGIDTSGTAVIAFHPDSEPRFLLNLVSSRTFELLSTFTPRYNMLLNLLEHRNITATKVLLNKSFAQFSQEKSNSKMKSRIAEERKAIEGYTQKINCDKGDFKSYFDQVLQITRLERDQKSSKRDQSRQGRYELSELLSAGSVIRVKTAGKFQTGLVTKIIRERKGQESYWIVLENGDGKKFHLNEIDPIAGIISELVINRTTDFSKREARKQIATVLRSFGYQKPEKSKSEAESRLSVEELRSNIRKHPCHSCKDLYEHLRWAERKEKLVKSVDALELNFNNSMMTLSNKCDEVLKLLKEINYIDIGEDKVILNRQANILREIHSDQDLLTAETIVNGLLDNLTVEEMPSVLSSFIYQPRRDEYEIPGNLSQKVRERAKDITILANQLINLEMKYKLEYVRLPHFGVAEQVRKWAQGESLQKVLKNSDLAPGDFVRVAKQVTDLLRQIAKLKIDPISQIARESVHRINRGVVAYEPTVFEDQESVLDNS
jgi:ATP-dependent RNA helicase HelY